jgi:hypothetical protein
LDETVARAHRKGLDRVAQAQFIINHIGGVPGIFRRDADDGYGFGFKHVFKIQENLLKGRWMPQHFIVKSERYF